MREAAVLDAVSALREVSCGERISLEVGLLAGRLADTLERVPSTRADLSGAVDFLRSLTGSAPEERPAWMVGNSPAERRPPGPPHPLDRLAEGLGLTPMEQDLVLLAGLPEEHEGLASVLSTLHPNGEPWATTGLAALVFCASPEDRPRLRETLVGGAARRYGAFEIRGDAPFFNRSLRPGAAVWPVLHGIDTLPEGMRPVRAADERTAAGLGEWLAAPDVRRAAAALESGRPWLIHLATEKGDVGLHRGTALVRSAGGRALPLRLTSAEPGSSDLAVLHAVLRGAVPVLALPEADGPAAAAHSVPRAPGPLVMSAPHGALAVPADVPVLEVRCESLSPSARTRLWVAVLPEMAGDAPRLASSYTADAPTVVAAARDARGRAELDGRPVEGGDVAESLRTRSTVSGAEGVAIRRPRATWADLVLREDRMSQLREALGRVRHQKTVLDDWGFLAGRPGARGVRMLLSGPPGTGKTLSAEVLAGELGVDLLVADVSRLVSKWIGETEKNLARVFDAAERAQAVLLFDEADALFARRTDVSDSTSRYANLETAYLLTRLERYEGLAVLSTNLRRNIDQAFLRRLEFVVEYAEPGVEERLALWRCHVPPGAPLADDLCLEEVASLYPLVGGHIRNAAVAAAFLAAGEGTPLTRRCLIRAIRREYEKAGRAFPGPPPDEL
ncbi:MAG TPA: ATP-binding protein [Thermoanaerobaculia bacterium]